MLVWMNNKFDLRYSFRLVDDVASQVRLYKKASLALRTRNKESETGGGGKLIDLESLFFDSEVAMEGNLCRDLAASIQQEEGIYLQEVAELLLFLLLPQVSNVFTVLLMWQGSRNNIEG